MGNHSIFDHIFFSAPNHLGGLFSVRDGACQMLDDRPTCGIHCDTAADLFARGVQLGDTLAITSRDRHDEWSGDWADIHDVLIDQGVIYLVSTHQNAVVAVDADTGSERQRWGFADAPDSWHLNCLGQVHDKIHFTAFGDFQDTRGYKGNSDARGFMRRLVAGNALPWIAGLSQPHSILAAGEDIYLCNSEKGEVWHCSPAGVPLKILSIGAYTRGLALRDGILYVGLSASRNISESVADGCGALVAVDIHGWREVARMPVPSTEIYDVVAMPDCASFGVWTERILLAERQRVAKMLSETAQKLVLRTNEIHNLKLALGFPIQ